GRRGCGRRVHGGPRGSEPRALRRRHEPSARRPPDVAARARRHRPGAAGDAHMKGRSAHPLTRERIARAHRVLDIERAALGALRDRLDEAFSRALDHLLACRGKVIVTGVGKSGIVCRKVAATLASTGTPAFFLHAGEGSHGDVGTFVRGDLLLAVSNSGESQEVLALLPAARRLGLPLIAICGNPTSSLAQAAAVVGGVGALVGVVTDGDLRRGLERAADIRLLTARDLMTTAPKTIGPGALAAEAVAVMECHAITSLFVLADGSRRPRGVIHLHD